MAKEQKNVKKTKVSEPLFGRAASLVLTNQIHNAIDKDKSYKKKVDALFEKVDLENNDVPKFSL